MSEIRPEDISKQVKAMAKCLVKDLRPLQTLAAKNAESILKPRIFNDGEAADGSGLSAYSEGHKKTRTKGGFQTGTKDLQMSGILFNSIQVVDIKGDIVLGFTPGKRPLEKRPRKKKGAKARKARKKISNQKLASHLEEQEGKEIFKLGIDEQKQVLKVMDAAVIKTIDKCFNQF